MIARKILRNPEQLRGQVPEAEFKRWQKLSHTDSARTLPQTALVVVGEDHEPWVDRRHLGPQGGIGVTPWGVVAKARRDALRRGTKDRSVTLIDALKSKYPDRFGDLEPPKRTFTTFTRIMESTEARAHIGIDVDAQGSVLLRRGEASLQLLEEILRDLRKPLPQRLTSRRIHTTTQIAEYLGNIEDRLGSALSEEPVTLSDEQEGPQQKKSTTGTSRRRTPDVLRTLTAPTVPRLLKIYDELRMVKKANAPNAAMILTRVLIELAVDHHSTSRGLVSAGDRNSALEVEVRAFLKDAASSNLKVSSTVRSALLSAPGRGHSLSEKLRIVIEDLMSRGEMNKKEGAAKLRELKASDVFPLLNDAVHRLENVPSMGRVDHILEVVRPVFNAMKLA